MFFKIKKFQNILIFLIIASLMFCAIFYCILFFALPKFINSNYFIQKIEAMVFKKTKANIKILNHDFIIKKNLCANLKIEKLTIENAFSAQNINIYTDIKTISVISAKFDYVYADKEKLEEIFNKKENNKKNKSKSKFLKITKLNIADADLFIEGVKLKVQNFNYSSKTDSSFNVSAQNIPVNSLVKANLNYQKSKDNSKKFIENFRNYNGKVSFNLIYENQNLSGFIKADKLSAIYIPINLPLCFENAYFDIKNNKLTSKALGLAGDNRAIHYLKITNILSPQREVFGQISAPLDEKISRKYLRHNIRILKIIDVTVSYHVKNKISVVEYFINLNKGSDIFYKDAYLGYRGKRRILNVKTIKDFDNLHIDKYTYSTAENNKIHNIATGNGLFVKENGRMKPEYITCRTNGYAPVSVTGFFGRYLKGGEFKGNLKYDFVKKTITGNFEVINTIFNDFFVEKASVIADDKRGNIKAQGTYKQEIFSCISQVRNKFDGVIVVYDMKLFLDKYIIKKHSSKAYDKPQNKKTDFSERMRKIDMTIKKWSIDVNEILFEGIAIEKINIFGKLENSIFEFTIPKLNYAKGILTASGKYNFTDDSSDIIFSAQNIDSDIAATQFFNLEKQIQGVAKANLEIKTFNKLETLKAKSNFEIKDGFLPQLANFEFMVKKSKNGRKIRISDLTNADLTKAKSLNSDIKGSFELNNYKLENINLTSQQKSLSLFIEGNYHIKSQNAFLDMYGKYDLEAPKGVKILFVPFNWILNFVFRTYDDKNIYRSKINKIPSIDAKTNRIKFFKINLKGNINTGDFKVNIKGLK